MNFKLDVVRNASVAALAVALLASCGGGTQIESFVPRRVIAFGDEASLINTDGTKYTVNGVVFDTTVTPNVPVAGPVLDCTSNQVWAQQLAYSYGLAFKGRCESTVVNANGVMLADVGKKAADLNGQIDNFLLTESFTSTDLVTVMVGVNDIIDAAASATDPVAAVELAGTQVGEAVVRITDRGAKVIVSTVPDVGFTPYAISAEANAPGTVATLSNLTARFNTKLRLKLQDVRDGGRAVGLVLADELVLAMVRNMSTYGLTVIDKKVCTVDLPNCNMMTRDAAAVTTSYGYDWLWADDRHLGGNAQGRLGALAVTRARNNPF